MLESNGCATGTRETCGPDSRGLKSQGARNQGVVPAFERRKTRMRPGTIAV